MKRAKTYCATRCGDVFVWQAGAGPALLLLHQASQSSEEYLELARCLTDRYTVVALDYPGHGRSDDPDHELDVDEYCATVMDVLDALGHSEVDIFGHHTGGVLAINLAVTAPSRVRRIILSGVGVRTQENVQAFFDTPLSRDLPMDEAGEFLTKTWDVYRRMTSPGFSPQVTFRSFILGLEARRRPYDAHVEVMKWDRTPELAKIRQPTLLIRGEFDHFAESPEQLLRDISDCHLEHIAGGGPFLPQEKPTECAALIHAFLNTEGSTSAGNEPEASG